MSRISAKEKYERYWSKNKDRVNEQRRERYANDLEFRERMLIRCKTESVKEKRRSRKESNSIRAREWRIKNPDKKRANQNKAEKKRCQNLSDTYIVKLIKDETNNIPRELIPADLIEIMRIQIKTKRILKKAKL